MKKSLRIFAYLSAVPALLAARFAMAAGQPAPWAKGLQEGVTPVRHQMDAFHDGILMPIITVIALFVLALLIYVVVRFNAKANPTPSKTSHNTMLEVVWTLIPVLILVVIIIPSMKLLYFADRTADAEMTLKVIGHQWNWEYEYPDHGEINFTALMVQDEDLKPGQPRLLTTDNPVVLPVDTNIRLLMTSVDVLHAWAVPAFGVKLDTVPGRINETWVRIEKPGTYYGQCSELCGALHGFMPIEIHAVSTDEFAKWVVAQGGTMPEKPETTAQKEETGE
ncbi:MAG: cytochrome c oxidase subunit II [Alphaproteobacteria bacterium]|nr:cytochrome c oxidase subunit II [Alphaproteobacteria bacterium]